MSAENIVKAIKNAKNIAIISHINPDGDTVGASTALFRAIQMYGATPYIFCDDTPKEKLQTLDYVENYQKYSCERFDLAIAVDCADAERMGEAISIFNRAKNTASIDHHKTNRGYAKVNYINVNAAATCEIMYEVIRLLLGIIEKDIASLLYTGLVTDSGGFTFSSVTPNTMRVASELLKTGIEAHLICDKFLKSTKVNIFNLKNRVLSKTKFYDDYTIGIITFRKEDFDSTNTDSTATEGIINNVVNIDTVKVACSISEQKDKDFKISFRSKDCVDCSKIVMLFGGGGHKNAAGCRLSGFYEDVVDKVLKAIRDEIC